MTAVDPADLEELYFLFDRGALVVYQEKETSWVGALAFSTEEKAREFLAASGLRATDIAAISTSDPESLGALIGQIKKRATRNALLDLDWSTGKCIALELEGDRLGRAHEWQFARRGAK